MVTLLPGIFPAGVALFGLAADANNIWGTDQGNNKLAQYVLAGNTINEFAPAGGFAANAGLEDLTVPSFDPNNVYFTELNANKIGKFPTAGVYSR